MTGSVQNNKQLSLGDLCGASAFAVSLIAAWLYVAGWTYTYQYFDRFGIPLLMVDLPKEHVFVYGSVVARQFPWCLTILAVTCFLLVGARRILGRVLRGFALPLAVLFLFGMFLLGHSAGVDAALGRYEQQRSSDYDAYPRVRVWVADSSTSPANIPLREDLTQGCYRLLLHSQHRLFLIRPIRGDDAAEIPVVVLPWDQVHGIRLLNEYTSCK